MRPFEAGAQYMLVRCILGYTFGAKTTTMSCAVHTYRAVPCRPERPYIQYTTWTVSTLLRIVHNSPYSGLYFRSGVQYLSLSVDLMYFSILLRVLKHDTVRMITDFRVLTVHTVRAVYHCTYCNQNQPEIDPCIGNLPFFAVFLP